jgi:DNA-binding CsgD family transcriptional regulator
MSAQGPRDVAPTYLSLVAPHLPPALEGINVPAYVIDDAGRIRWLNNAAKEIVGDAAVGKLFTSVVEPNDVRRARSRFAQSMRGEQRGDFAVDIVSVTGDEQRIEISSVPLRSGHRAIGVFGLARPRQQSRDRPSLLDGRLTARQHEVLGRVAEGHATHQIATDLNLSPETVRNHVRNILQRLGTNSRLEAVAVARREEIL